MPVTPRGYGSGSALKCAAWIKLWSFKSGHSGIDYNENYKDIKIFVDVANAPSYAANPPLKNARACTFRRFTGG